MADFDTVILSAFMLVSCGEQRSAFKKKTKALFNKWVKQKESTQVLRLCTTSPFSSLDPRTGREEETSYLHKMLFEGLMRIGKIGKPEPAISERVEISDDGKYYRFFLRKSQWSNGMPLTAHDFLYSWKMVLSRKGLAPLNYLFDYIKNAKEIKEGTVLMNALGVTVIDDHILEVELLTPCIPFLEICALTLFSPICQKIDETQPSWMETEEAYVCNGPFVLEKKASDGGVILKKNPLYWEANKVKLDQVTIPLVSQEEGKNLFLNQRVDALLNYFYKKPFSISIKAPHIQRLKGCTAVRYLRFDCSKPPFHNQKVRKALALSLDREAIARSFSKGAVPYASFYSPEHRFSRPQASFKQDLSKARLLMIEAMAEDQAVYHTIFEQKLHALESGLDAAKLICNQLKEALGFDWRSCAVGLSSIKDLHKALGLRLCQWMDRVSDPGYFLGIFSNTNLMNNPARWINSSFQSLVHQLITAQTAKQREALFCEAETLLQEELPMIPLFYLKEGSLYHTKAHGLQSSSLQEFDIRFAFKSPKSIQSSASE